MPNPLKEKIRDGGVVLTASVALSDPTVVEIMGYAKFDGVFIMTEHGLLNPETVSQMIVSAYAAGTVPILRIPQVERTAIKQGLDMGAVAILAPEVKTREDLEALVRAAKYYPDGDRGVGPRRCTRFGAVGLKEYLSTANDEILLMAMIETREAYENIEALTSVPGVDVFIVGPYDLSAALGVPGDFSNPILTRAIDRIVTVCKQRGVAPGIPAETPQEIAEWTAKGVRVFECCSAEGFLRRRLAEFRESLLTGAQGVTRR